MIDINYYEHLKGLLNQNKRRNFEYIENRHSTNLLGDVFSESASNDGDFEAALSY